VFLQNIVNKKGCGRPFGALRSYGLYLIHILVFWCFDITFTGHIGQEPANRPGYLLARLAVVGVCSVMVAYLSRRYFEEWFLRRKGA
jgi:peptidoglycan/LPS O-acetylase OafA/YrhL